MNFEIARSTRTPEEVALLRLPASHSDSNTDPDEVVYLNQRNIDGETTNICTSESEFTTKLRTAVNEWNRALAALTQPLAIVRTSNCADTNAVNVDVVLRRANSDDDDENRCLTARACYIAARHDLPPRKFFRYRGSEHHSVIIYRATDVTVGTLLHELGHVLGLAHYDGSDQCTVLRDSTVDPAGDHFSVMTGTGSRCKSNHLVTGRDLRDFYEEYHVGPITNVAHLHSTSLPTQGTRTRLDWGDSGATEAWHSASRFVVMAQTSGGWRFVESFSVSRRDPSKTPGADGEYRAISGFTFDDPMGPATMYRVVGITQGDIQLHTLDEDVTFAVAGSSATYQQGDPTYILGISTSGLSGIHPTSPAVLSAGIDHRYCYAGGARGIISRRASGGSGTSSLPPITTAVCPYQVGQRTISVAARWGSGTGAITRRIALPVQVIATPRQIRQVSTTITPTATSGAVQISECATGETVTVRASPAPASALTAVVNGVRLATTPPSFVCPSRTAAEPRVNLLVLRSDGGGRTATLNIVAPLEITQFSSGRSCNAGERSVAHFGLRGGTGTYEYDDVDAGVKRPTGSTAALSYYYRCPSAAGPNDRLTISVQDSAGRVVSKSVPLTVNAPPPAVTVGPAMPTGLTVTQTSQRHFRLSWNAVPGATGYDAKVRSNGNIIRIGDITSDWLWAPAAGTQETIYLRSRDAQGRVSAWATVQATTDPPMLDVPTNVRARNVTSTGAVLQWVPVPNVHFYEVWHSGWTTTDTTEADVYRFTDLEAGKDYTLSVRTRLYDLGTSHWVKVRITTPP